MNSRKSKQRSPENTTISVSMRIVDADLLTRAADLDGRNRSEFIRHYSLMVARQMLDEEGIGIRRKRVNLG